MTTRAQGAALAAVALNDRMTLLNDEVTAGPYRTATDPLRYAIFVDKPSPHWLPKGRHVFGSPEEVAWHLVGRFGVSGVRRMVDVAYRRAGLTPPATPPKAAKRGRKRNGGDGRRGTAPRRVDPEQAQSAHHAAVARGDWDAAADAARDVNLAAVEDGNAGRAAAWKKLHRIAVANATRKPNGSPTVASHRATVRALAARGLVVAESTSYSGHFGRFGQAVSANRARLTHHVETGARLTSEGRAALAARG